MPHDAITMHTNRHHPDAMLLLLLRRVGPQAAAGAGGTPAARAAAASSRRPSSLAPLLLLPRNYRATAALRKHAPLPAFSSITHSNPKIERLLREYFDKAQEDYVPPSLLPVGADAAGAETPAGAGGTERIFVNNMTNLTKVDVIGMDLDFTLLEYTHSMEELIYDLGKDWLIDHGGYPAELRDRKYDPEFAIRGLAVDTDKGLLCKLSYLHQIAIRTVFRGRRRLKKEEVLAEYGGSTHVSPEYRNHHMKPLVDLFSLSEACLLADVLDHLVAHDMHHDARAVVEDVLRAINNVHVSGRMHSEVLKDPAKYMRPAPYLGETLQRFRDVGKKLFLCSNSGYEYVAGGMQYLLGSDWRDYWDVIIVAAGKPAFFTSDRPFRQISQSTGKIRWTQVRSLEKGKVYTQGSMQQLSKMMGWSGYRTLYFGDSLWADLVDARRLSGWRTGAVIRELEAELGVQQSPQYRALAHKVILMTELLRLVQEEMERVRSADAAAAAVAAGGGTAGAGGSGATAACERERQRKYSQQEEDVRVLEFLEKYLRELNISMSKLFNKNFGSVFRAEGEPTLFSFSLRRYVDIYTSRIENLRHYSPQHRFYPSRGVSFPHDPYIPAIVRPTLSGLGEEDHQHQHHKGDEGGQGGAEGKAQ